MAVSVSDHQPLGLLPKGIIRFVLFLAVLGLGIRLATDENPVTNVQYRLWKTGIAPSLYPVGLRYLGLDSAFCHSLNGKTLEQVRCLFPTLIPPSKTNFNKRTYSAGMGMTDKDTRWIGDSQWALRMQNGRITEIMLYKG
jgi:hypothetical protein